MIYYTFNCFILSAWWFGLWVWFRWAHLGLIYYSPKWQNQNLKGCFHFKFVKISSFLSLRLGEFLWCPANIGFGTHPRPRARRMFCSQSFLSFRWRRSECTVDQWLLRYVVTVVGENVPPWIGSQRNDVGGTILQSSANFQNQTPLRPSTFTGSGNLWIDNNTVVF